MTNKNIHHMNSISKMAITAGAVWLLPESGTELQSASETDLYLINACIKEVIIYGNLNIIFYG